MTDVQTLLNQVVLNVYYYRVTSITGVAQGGYALFDTWFQANVMTPVRAIQNQALVHTGLQIRNLSNGLDYYENSFSLAGTQSESVGTVMPPNVCWTFRLVRESLATRNGYKRYAGVSEGLVANGVSALTATPANNVINALKADYVEGAVTIAEPVIPKRPILVPAGNYVYASIGDAQFRGLGTQNTRKIGRGI